MLSALVYDLVLNCALAPCCDLLKSEGKHFGRIAARAVALTALALSAAGVGAAEPKNLTVGELALTPPFCQDVQTINGWSQHGRESPRSPFWISKMGKTFWGMHHYCWAVINVHRSKAAGLTRQERDFMIHSAIKDHYYVVEIAPPDFVLLPEIFFLIGEAHMMVEEYVQAIEAFQKSTAIKPDYWPPYEGHARLLERLGKKTEARALIEAGLRIMPAEPKLRAQFVRLGGKVSEIPLAPMPAASSASSGTQAPR